MRRGIKGFLLFLALILAPVAASAADKKADIVLQGESIAIRGEGVLVTGQTATITEAGEYTLRGTLEEGQILVSVSKEEKVTLVLEGTQIVNSEQPCIYVEQADKLTVKLAAGSENTLTSGRAESAAYDEAAEGAALQSKDDLTISGSGTLVVNGYLNNGIQTSNDLKIKGGTVIVTAVNNAVKGKDSVTMEDGSLVIVSDGDGVVTQGKLTIEGGTMDIRTGGGHVETQRFAGREPRGGFAQMNTQEDTQDAEISTKGLKSDTEIEISGGSIQIDALDDAIHANETVKISGGRCVLASSDDAIHADNTLEISDGTVEIAYCYEGLEAMRVLVSGGDIHLVATDDGVNAADGSAEDFDWGRGAKGRWEMGQMEFQPDMPEEAPVESSDDVPLIEITGGNLTIVAGYDGLDANGNIRIEGGTTIVSGRNEMNDGAIDYDRTAVITGGVLLALGGNGGGFASAETTQCAFADTLPAAVQAGETFAVVDDTGNELFRCDLPVQASQFLFSCPELEIGRVYTVEAGEQSVSVEQSTISVGMTQARGGRDGRMDFGHGFIKGAENAELPEGFEPPEGFGMPEEGAPMDGKGRGGRGMRP